MKLIQQVLLVLVIWFLTPSIAAAGTVYVRCGKLIYDAEKPPISSAIVVITDGKITAVGTDIKIPAGAEEIDLSRNTVIPGLIDAHIHLTGPRDDGISNGLAILRASRCMNYALLNGVVAARVLGTPGFIDVALADAIEEGTAIGPRLIPGANSISVPGGHGDDYELPEHVLLDQYYTPRNGFINSPADAEKAVHLQMKYGARVIKVLASGGVVSPLDSPKDQQLTPEELKVIVEIAHMNNLKVASHAENRLSIMASLNAGVDSIEHGSDLDANSVAIMKDRGVYLIPTLAVIDYILTRSDQDHLPPYMLRKEIELAKTHFPSFQLALRSGVLIAAGSDTNYEPGKFTIKDEMYAEVKYGMTPQQALTSATKSSAALLGLQDLGTVSVGKEGDLIAVDGDPLSDIHNLDRIRTVVFKGKVLLLPDMKSR